MLADLKSNEMQCKSIHAAEYIAATFGIALLFNLCFREKKSEGPLSGCTKKWPLLAAVEINEGSKSKKDRLPDELTFA